MHGKRLRHRSPEKSSVLKLHWQRSLQKTTRKERRIENCLERVPEKVELDFAQKESWLLLACNSY